MMRNDTSNQKPTAVFMMGGPGAGKGYVRKRRLQHLPVVDCDQFKEGHPDFDPKNPGALHAWSSQEAARAFYRSLGEGQSFVYDGTGTNAEKYLNMIRQASEAGFETRIMYVKANLQVALERNRKRTRTVPEEIVRSKHATVDLAFEMLCGQADHCEIVENN